MQLLWGINHHLLTSYADPLKAGGNLKILWMVAGREKKEEESEKKKVLEYEPLPLSWGVCGAFMSWQLIVSVGFLNGELRRIVSWLFKRAVGQREKSDGCEGDSPVRLFLKHFIFRFADTSPMGRPPHTRRSDHFKKPEICQKQSHFLK